MSRTRAHVADPSGGVETLFTCVARALWALAWPLVIGSPRDRWGCLFRAPRNMVVHQPPPSCLFQRRTSRSNSAFDHLLSQGSAKLTEIPCVATEERVPTLEAFAIELSAWSSSAASAQNPHVTDFMTPRVTMGSGGMPSTAFIYSTCPHRPQFFLPCPA